MAITDKELERLASELGSELAKRGWQVTCAESCTGGWVAKTLTDIAGSSAWFGWGFVTYANEAKLALLEVPAELVDEQGVVSEPVVLAMAEGARKRSGAELAVAVSGIAGPGGGSVAKPVGTVWFGWVGPGLSQTQSHCFSGDREAIRRESVRCALAGLLDLLAAS